MRAVQMVWRAYVILLVYALVIVSITTLTMSHVLLSLVQMSLCFALFTIGARASFRVPAAPPTLVPNRRGAAAPRWLYLALGLMALISSVYVAEYYTGKSPSEVLTFLRTGESLYLSYQVFNADLVAGGGGRGFSLSFALLVFMRALLVSSVFSFIPRGGRVALREWLLLLSAIAAEAYFGVARGTGLEFFLIGSMLLFAVMMRPRLNRSRRLAPIFGILGMLGLALLYSSLLSARGVDFGSFAGDDVQFDPAGLGNVMGPTLVSFFLTFYSYFGFGFHYVATFISSIWIVSPGSFLAGLLPGGFSSINIHPQVLIRNYLIMGPRWHPDSILLISRVGFLGFLLVCFALGRMARVLERERTLHSISLSYFVFLQMLSFPVGNFVKVDMANLVVISMLGCISLLRAMGLLPRIVSESFVLSPLSRGSNSESR